MEKKRLNFQFVLEEMKPNWLFPQIEHYETVTDIKRKKEKSCNITYDVKLFGFYPVFVTYV